MTSRELKLSYVVALSSARFLLRFIKEENFYYKPLDENLEYLISQILSSDISYK